jgi:hypothetical protein
MSLRNATLAALVAVSALTGGGTALAAPAGHAVRLAPAKVTHKVSVIFKGAKLPKGSVPAAAEVPWPGGSWPVGCLPPIPNFSRTDLCYMQGAAVTDATYADGTLTSLEFVFFAVQTEVALSASSAHVRFELTSMDVEPVGNDKAADAPTITLSIVCAHPCRDTAPTLVAAGPVAGTTGAAVNEVIVERGHVVIPRPMFSYLADDDGSDSEASFTDLGVSFRCDRALPRVAPGCVFPSFIPTVNMSGQSVIAANIRKAQAGPLHIGKPGGIHPLHRASNKQTIANNRYQATCTVKTEAGKERDEYPFASTMEGGRSLPASDRICALVPDSENDAQAIILRNFYRLNRILDGDAFWVQA